jgi:hypothetical protein
MTKKLSEQIEELAEKIDDLESCVYTQSDTDEEYIDLDDIIENEIDIYDKGRRTKEELFERWKELEQRYKTTFLFFPVTMSEEEKEELEAIEEELGYSLVVYKDLKKEIEKQISLSDTAFLRECRRIEKRALLTCWIGITLVSLVSLVVAYFLS